MGLVIVFLRAPFGGYDALADPVGWGLVVAGLLPLRERLRGTGTTLALAVVAGICAVPLAFPAVDDRLAESTQWVASLPQSLFCVMLCASLAVACAEAKAAESGRFTALRWVFVALAVAPVLVYGGPVDALAAPIAVMAVLANVYLVYLLFKVSRRAELTDAPAEAH
jgi:hypothetical protein